MRLKLVAMAMIALGLLIAPTHAEESAIEASTKAARDLIRAANDALECVDENREHASVCRDPIIEFLGLETEVGLISLTCVNEGGGIEECDAYLAVELGMSPILASALAAGVCVDLGGSINDCAKLAARMVVISGAFDAGTPFDQ